MTRIEVLAMAGANLVAFLAASVVFLVIPGPSALFIVGRALANGRRTALLTVIGNQIGVHVLLGLVALGVGTILQRYAGGLVVLKLVGGLFLVWLGWRAWRHRGALGTVTPSTPQRAGPLATSTPGEARRIAMRDLGEGVLTGLTNPKALVYFATIPPQFATSNGLPVGLQVLILGTFFNLAAGLVDLLWAMSAGTARAWLASSPARLRRTSGAGAVLLMGVGVGLLVSGSRPSRP